MMNGTGTGCAMTISEQMPDADAIKMFVGQVPKSWTENDVRMYFLEFGPIYLVNVLRDKLTKQSRGCCFITYYKRKSALDAQNACHNLKTLPGMNHPLQMKPADNENRAERKIFVGMLSKKLNELDLRSLFSRFGLIEECSILRDANGISRGCGFVTFSSKACALGAIKAMHHSTSMEGCSSPLVVKFADVQRDKVAKDAIALCTSLLADTQKPYLPVLHLMQQNCGGVSGAPTGSSLLGGVGVGSGGYSVGGQSLQQLSPQQQHQNLTPDMATLTFLANLAASTQQQQQIGLPTSVIQTSGGFNFPSQLEGPDGSNLFIYHLPQDFTDVDLLHAFSSFGNILSSKVFIDKATNLSKCFGFVSYDNVLSAHLAINSMNGFQIGPKRLKVQLKRPKDKPY